MWHFSLTSEDETSIERVQKVACYLILHEQYEGYTKALYSLNLTTLKSRRSILSLRFARKCIKHPTAKNMFPLNPEVQTSLRKREKFTVQSSKTDRLLYSSIPQLQRALNADQTHKI